MVVSTVDRAGFLPGLLAALEAQRAAPPFEVVVADDGSSDDTWEVLRRSAAQTSLPLRAVRLRDNAGAAAGRNAGVAHARAPVVAFTDDDCLPTPGWLAALVEAFEPHDGGRTVDVVQGRTEPEPVEPPGTWARSLWVTGPTPWMETCNIAYRRSAFDAAGGFAPDDALLGRAGRGQGFGEDTLLGHQVLAQGGRRVFAPAAVVHHRWRPGSFGDHVAERRLLALFPALARRVPAVADSLWAGVFLSRRTAAVDLAVVAVAGAVVTRRPVWLAGALPWLSASWGPARARRGALPLRLGQAAVADAAGLVALLRGSVRHRRLVL